MQKILLAAALAASAAAASAAQYEIDPFHSNARFEIDHFGTSTNVGGIYKVTGNVHFDPAKKTGSVEAVLPLANLQSSSDEFTKHLKSADIFNAEKYPEIRFASTKFIFDGKKVSAVQIQLLPNPDEESGSLRRRFCRHHRPHPMGSGLPGFRRHGEKREVEHPNRGCEKIRPADSHLKCNFP